MQPSVRSNGSSGQNTRLRAWPVLGLVLAASCLPSRARGPDPGPRLDAKPAPAPVAPTVVNRPDHPLTTAEAKTYALALVNRDRATEGLGPVAWDDTAEVAAKRHARDMAGGGFTAHWGRDGSVPEQRYTEAGGSNITTENVACFADGKTRVVRPDGPFDPAEIERFEAAFFGEKPPHDGHRLNILGKDHTNVGMGFAGAEGTSVVCLDQEFTDAYGRYDAVPKSGKLGGTIHVSGDLAPGVVFGGIGLGMTDQPKPIAVADLMATGGYNMPPPQWSYFPPGFKTPIPVLVQGQHFALDLPLTNLKGPALYELGIYVRQGSSNKLVPVSLRTIALQ